MSLFHFPSPQVRASLENKISCLEVGMKAHGMALRSGQRPLESPYPDSSQHLEHLPRCLSWSLVPPNTSPTFHGPWSLRALSSLGVWHISLSCPLLRSYPPLCSHSVFPNLVEISFLILCVFVGLQSLVLLLLLLERKF